MPLERSHAEILGAHRDALLNEMRKCLPATVTAVHPERQTVDVQVAVANVVFDDYGTAYEEPAPGIADVPLGVMRGGGFLVWVPVAVGDSVLLVFSDLSTDRWRAGDGTPQPPGFMGKHTPDSPFAIPCVAPDAKKFADPGTDKVIIGHDGSQAQIRISTGDIELGAGATEFVALADKVDGNFSAMATALGPTPITTVGQAISAIAALQAVFTPPVGPSPIVSTAATLVKAK